MSAFGTPSPGKPGATRAAAALAISLASCLLTAFAAGAPAAAASGALAVAAGGAPAPNVAPYRVAAPERASASLSLPADLGERIAAHATALAARGPRPAGSAGERAAADYVAAAWRELGLRVKREAFTAEGFEARSIELSLAGRPVTPVSLGLDPYAGPLSFAGEAVPVKGGDEPPADLRGRLVVTDHPLVGLMVMDREPALVVCVGAEDFAAFAAQPSRALSLSVRGERTKIRSANLTATVGPRTGAGRRPYVTAHLDAYRDSPGANDNGTGLGALIELARHFQALASTLPGPITFVAFGAEEVSALGSRVYLERHARELGGGAVVLNLDTLGGAQGPWLGSDPGVKNVPEAVLAAAPRSQLPPALARRAWEGLASEWRIQSAGVLPLVLASNYPDWLQAIVAESAAALGCEVTSRNLISDHQTFAQAGVPAISFQSRRHSIHSPQNTADKLVTATVDATARLAGLAIERVLAAPPRAGTAAPAPN